MLISSEISLDWYICQRNVIIHYPAVGCMLDVAGCKLVNMMFLSEENELSVARAKVKTYYLRIETGP